MPDWTQPAREEVRRYFTRVRASLAESGADPDEVIGDLDRHIDEEIAAASLAVVTEEDARRILARIGPPDSQPRAEPQRPTLVENALQALGNKLVSDRAKDNGFALRGRVADLELAGPERPGSATPRHPYRYCNPDAIAGFAAAGLFGSLTQSKRISLSAAIIKIFSSF